MSVTAHRGVSARAALSIVGARLLLKPLIELYPVRSWSLAPLSWAEGIAGLVGWMPTDVEVDVIELAGVRVERLVPTAGELRSDTALCYYHGGAFLAGGPATHRRVASALARALGVTVFNVDYRQLPDVGVGTSVEDGYRVYRAVADSGRYAQVGVGGDSAGGYISAKVVELAYLDAATGPSVYFGFSPLLAPTVVPGDPRHAIDDAYLTAGKLASLRELLDRGPVALRGNDDATLIDPAAFPPAIVIACTEEMLRVDAERLHARLDASGRACDLHLFAGGIHAFPVMVGSTPEAARAVEITAAFLTAAFEAGVAERAA